MYIICSEGSFGLRRSCTEVRRPTFRWFCVLLQHAAVGTAAGSPLLSLASPPRPRVLHRRPPKSLLEHSSKKTAFYMPLSRRNLSKCVQSPSVAFVVGFPGLHKTTKKSAAESRYMTSEAQNFLLNKHTRLCTLRFGRCGGGDSRSGLAPQIVDTKIVFWGKNARIHAFLVPRILLHSKYIFSGPTAWGPVNESKMTKKTKQIASSTFRCTTVFGVFWIMLKTSAGRPLRLSSYL